MRNTYKYSLITLVKEKNILIWALLFPLIMSTLFFVMFSNLDEAFGFKPIEVAIVDDESYREAEAFETMMEALAQESDDQVLIANYVGTEEDAAELLKNQDVIGYYMVDGDGSPKLFVTPSSRLDNIDTVNQTILKDVLDNYVRSNATVEAIAEKNPSALADSSTLEMLYSSESFTEEISVIANTASGSVRYFYALLGFAAIMAANVGMVAITRTQANLSPLGARRAVGATSRAKTLTATLLASWTLSFLCLVIAFGYMRFVLGIGFGDRDLACIFGLAVASLMTTALGALIGAIPKIGEGGKSGILTGFTCLLALFAGLYGTASMSLADELTRSAPLLQLLNPSKQVADMFYSLYFYDTYTQFFAAITVLTIMAAILFAAAAILMRRQRYASI